MQAIIVFFSQLYTAFDSVKIPWFGNVGLLSGTLWLFALCALIGILYKIVTLGGAK